VQKQVAYLVVVVVVVGGEVGDPNGNSFPHTDRTYMIFVSIPREFLFGIFLRIKRIFISYGRVVWTAKNEQRRNETDGPLAIA